MAEERPTYQKLSSFFDAGNSNAPYRAIQPISQGQCIKNEIIPYPSFGSTQGSQISGKSSNVMVFDTLQEKLEKEALKKKEEEMRDLKKLSN